MEKVVIVFRKGPYGHINSLEGIRIAQGLLVLDVEAEAIFVDDGVFNLLKNQNPDGIGHHSVMGALEAMHRYDIPIFVCEKSMKQRGIKPEDLDPKLDAKVISLKKFGEIMLEADATFAL